MGVKGLVALASGALAGVGAFAWLARRNVEDLEPGRDAPGFFIDLDGHAIHYVEAGQGDPVVLIHGWNGSTFGFRYTIPELAQRQRVVAIDLLGYGYSARPADGDYSVGAQAELVRRAMDRLGIARAAVLGHSMGGAIAMRFALDHPERVERLILLSSATVSEMTRARKRGLLLRPIMPLLTRAMLSRSMVRRGLRTAVHDPALLTPELVEGHYRPLRMKGHARASAKHMLDRTKDIPLEPAHIRAPTLILWGEHDRWIPIERGRELAQLIPNARLYIVRGAGHLLLEEEPEECSRELLKFLSSAAGAPVLTGAAPV